MSDAGMFVLGLRLRFRQWRHGHSFDTPWSNRLEFNLWFGFSLRLQLLLRLRIVFDV